MQKGILIVFLMFLIFGMILPAGFVLASHDDSSDNSGSGSDSSSGSSDDSDRDNDEDKDKEDKENDDDKKERIRKKVEREMDRERFNEKIKREFREADGSRVKIEREVEIKDGKIKIKIKRTVIDAEGNKIETKIVIERDEDGIRKKIKLEGFDGFDVETELELEDEFEGDETELVAVLSNGRKAKIKLMPDQVVELALERLKSLNFTMELKEIKYKNEQRIVYNVETNKTGRFLGIVKLKIKLEGQIDPETGEFIRINKPWWAFLVTGEDGDQINERDKVTICHIPPGNPSAAHTITVGAPAVNTHTLRHGDTLGPCPGDNGNGNGGDGNETGEEPPGNETDGNQTIVELIVNLTEENNSSESGTARLVEGNEQTTINISMVGFTENVSQPVHIHLGDCLNVSTIAYPLTNILNGESITVINVTLNQLESELPLAINVHKSINESSVYVACGNLTFS